MRYLLLTLLILITGCSSSGGSWGVNVPGYGGASCTNNYETCVRRCEGQGEQYGADGFIETPLDPELCTKESSQ